MSALHDALKTLGPLDFSETPLENLQQFLSNSFSKGHLIVDSVPIPAPSDELYTEGRSRASSSASSASEISLSSARSAPPPPEVEVLQKEWKPVKINPRENPLGMSVYRLNGKDGKGAWFARRSVHEGLDFTKWKKGLEKEFPETMKVQGGPGQGNIRGIGGERRVEYKRIDGIGKMEVYLLSAQFPGPTAPRDFVTMFLTSDRAISSHTGDEVPRHFMVISRPCNHPDTQPRDGYVRGQYESVEFIREVSVKNRVKKSASASNLSAQDSFRRNRSASTIGREAILRNAIKNTTPQTSVSGVPTHTAAAASETTLSQSEGRARGKTISFDRSRGWEAKGEEMDIPREDEDEPHPIEWIMVTRSDPGGSVPRFMVERGTPGGIVSDASKFLDWACSKDMEDFESDNESLAGEDKDENVAHVEGRPHNHLKDLHNYQTNGILAGIEESSLDSATSEPPEPAVNGSGLYGTVASVAGAAGGYIASHTPAIITSNLPGQNRELAVGTERRGSVSSVSSTSSAESFASALETYEVNDAASVKTTESTAPSQGTTSQDKELQKLEEKKRKLEEKLNKTREKELSKKNEDAAKEEDAIKKAEERHEREIKKQEEKYKREVEKLELKKKREAQKAEEKKRKAIEKDEKTRMVRQLEELKTEVLLLRKEKDLLRGQVGELQAENTALAARVGRLIPQAEDVLRDVRLEVGRTGRLRASSLKGMTRGASFRSSSTNGDKEKENSPAPSSVSG